MGNVPSGAAWPRSRELTVAIALGVDPVIFTAIPVALAFCAELVGTGRDHAAEPFPPPFKIKVVVLAFD